MYLKENKVFLDRNAQPIRVKIVIFTKVNTNPKLVKNEKIFSSI